MSHRLTKGRPSGTNLQLFFTFESTPLFRLIFELEENPDGTLLLHLTKRLEGDQGLHTTGHLLLCPSTAASCLLQVQSEGIQQASLLLELPKFSKNKCLKHRNVTDTNQAKIVINLFVSYTFLLLPL